jgi:hypothetical protein
MPILAREPWHPCTFGSPDVSAVLVRALCTRSASLNTDGRSFAANKGHGANLSVVQITMRACVRRKLL